MSRAARSLVGLLVGLTTVILTGIGSTAFAAVGPPDGPASTTAPLPPPVAATVPVSDAGTSFAQQIAWMATGAGIVLVLAALAAGIAVLSRRHQVHTRQLQMP